LHYAEIKNKRKSDALNKIEYAKKSVYCERVFCEIKKLMKNFVQHLAELRPVTRKFFWGGFMGLLLFMYGLAIFMRIVEPGLNPPSFGVFILEMLQFSVILVIFAFVFGCFVAFVRSLFVPQKNWEYAMLGAMMGYFIVVAFVYLDIIIGPILYNSWADNFVFESLKAFVLAVIWPLTGKYLGMGLSVMLVSVMVAVGLGILIKKMKSRIK
jgi:hypothetical protein